MNSTATVLVVAGLAAFFVLGFVVSRLVRRPSESAMQSVATAPAPGLVPATLGSPNVSAGAVSALGFGSQAGIQVIADRLPAGGSHQRGRLTRTLSASSAISAELGRLGSVAPSVLSRTKDIYRVTVTDGGARKLMRAAGGGYHGDLVNTVTGRIESKAILQPLKGGAEALTILGPQAVWGLAAFAVGQHFEAEIAARLESIETKLDMVIQEMDRERLAELEAASTECERAAFRVLDGRNPTEVVAGLSAQKLVIDKNWSLALDALADAEKKLEHLQAEDELTATQVGGMWEELFGEEDRFTKDVRLFLAALAAKMKLISLLAVEDAAASELDTSVGAYRTRLVDEMKECHEALERLRSIVHRTARLDYSLGRIGWMPASLLSKGKKDKSNRLLVTLRSLLELEGQLEQLHLPFPSLPT